MASELKPCPFCGATAKAKPMGSASFTVMCENLHRMNSFPSKAEAIEAWNTRAAPAATDTGLVSNCDGKEQEAFETWAKSKRYDMHEHPLHYLFLDPKTNAAREGWNEAIRYCHSQAVKLLAAKDARIKELERQRNSTGCSDKDGNVLFVGDRVRYRKEGLYIKEEYWNPEYEIIFKAPCFTLRHVGGGKDAGSHDFILKCGGGNGDLELISRGEHGYYHDALEAKLAAAEKALEPFALISSEGVIKQETGQVTVITCAEYFHNARAVLGGKPS